MEPFSVVYTDNSKGGLDIERKILEEINVELVDAEQSKRPVKDLIRKSQDLSSPVKNKQSSKYKTI